MSKNSVIRKVSNGVIRAVILSLVLVVLFALVIKLTGMSSSLIKPLVQVIKVISVFYGVAVAIREIDRRGYAWGALVGALYTVFAFFMFSILDNSFAITVGLLNDMVFASIIGAISAVVLRMGRASAV